MTGPVTGVAINEETGNVSYAVWLDGLDETWSFDERDLESTGSFRKQDPQSGSPASIRISQRGRTIE